VYNLISEMVMKVSRKDVTGGCDSVVFTLIIAGAVVTGRQEVISTK